MFKSFASLHPVDRFSRVAVATCALFLTTVSVIGTTHIFGF